MAMIPKTVYRFGDGRIIMNGCHWRMDAHPDYAGSYAIMFVELDENDSPGVGNPVTEEVFTKSMEKQPEFAMLFKNVESLDVLLANLNRIRDYMTGAEPQ